MAIISDLDARLGDSRYLSADSVFEELHTGGLCGVCDQYRSQGGAAGSGAHDAAGFHSGEASAFRIRISHDLSILLL